MSNAAAIELYDRIADPLEAIDRMGEYLAKSGMFGCEKVEQGKVIAMACLSEKKNPMDIARTYHIIDGRLSMRADAMLAEFRNRGGPARCCVPASSPRPCGCSRPR